MHPLPPNKNLPIHLLVACFNNTVATYKYYWLLSILNQVEKGSRLISKKVLFADMVSHAWYTVHYFHVSFGKSDKLGEVTKRLQTIENIPVNAGKADILNQLVESNHRETKSLLQHFDTNVPHWFLSPWFPRTDKNKIYRNSQDSAQRPLYALSKEFISVDLLWYNYLIENSSLIRSFCYWNLSLFLQNRNPNVPDIPNKLIKPAVRNSLTKQRNYWKLYAEHQPAAFNCIYTGKNLIDVQFDIDHFIPYNFVSHDLLWNLIPADPGFNSTKTDKLPTLSRYFQPFFTMQKQSIDYMKQHHPSNKLLEDYLTLFPDLDTSITEENYRKRMEPILSIAANNGFEYLSL
jgi:hypothetical protein